MRRRILEHRLQVDGYEVNRDANPACYEDALKSAERLAKEHPGKSVIIFAAIAVVKVDLNPPRLIKL